MDFESLIDQSVIIFTHHTVTSQYLESTGNINVSNIDATIVGIDKYGVFITNYSEGKMFIPWDNVKHIRIHE